MSLKAVSEAVGRGRLQKRSQVGQSGLFLGPNGRACKRDPLRSRWSLFAKQVRHSTASFAAAASDFVVNPGLNRDKLGWGRVQCCQLSGGSATATPPATHLYAAVSKRS
jgi:hypothetical protein